MRIAGPGAVPFTPEKQRILIEAAAETIIQKMGPAEIVLYREGLPDPRSPDYKTESLPYVDVALNVNHLLTQTEIDRLLVRPSAGRGRSAARPACSGVTQKAGARFPGAGQLG